jgi:hypothetical protein
MKKAIGFGFISLLFVSITSIASTELKTLSAEDIKPASHSNSVAASHYQILLDLYNQGTKATLAELKGWWAGRCYSVEQPDSALPDALIVTHIQGTVEDGPFPGSTESRYLLSIVTTTLPSNPAYFDELTPELEKSFQNYVRSSEHLSSVAVENESEVVVNPDSKSTTHIRKSGNILVGKLYYDSVQPQMTCYFFKKLK